MSQVSFEKQASNMKLTLMSNKEITLYGDIEVLVLLEMHLRVKQADLLDILQGCFGAVNNRQILDYLDPDFVKHIKKNQ